MFGGVAEDNHFIPEGWDHGTTCLGVFFYLALEKQSHIKNL